MKYEQIGKTAEMVYMEFESVKGEDTFPPKNHKCKYA